MSSLEIFNSLDAETRARLLGLWDKIEELNEEPQLGCRATGYSIHVFYRETINDDEFLGVIIYGKKGGGKSTYAIKTLAAYLMRYEGLECGDAYREALSSLAFTAADLLAKIDEGREIIIWDDAGLWGSTYMWFDEQRRPYLEALLDWYDVVRTDVNILLMTTPSKKKLPPRIREDPDALIIKVAKYGHKEYRGRRIKISTATAARNTESLYNDKTYRTELFRDYYMVYLPDPVYQYYQILRKQYSKYARNRLKTTLQQTEEYNNPNTTPRKTTTKQ